MNHRRDRQATHVGWSPIVDNAARGAAGWVACVGRRMQVNHPPDMRGLTMNDDDRDVHGISNNPRRMFEFWAGAQRTGVSNNPRRVFEFWAGITPCPAQRATHRRFLRIDPWANHGRTAIAFDMCGVSNNRRSRIWEREARMHPRPTRARPPNTRATQPCMR